MPRCPTTVYRCDLGAAPPNDTVYSGTPRLDHVTARLLRVVLYFGPPRKLAHRLASSSPEVRGGGSQNMETTLSFRHD